MNINNIISPPYLLTVLPIAYPLKPVEDQEYYELHHKQSGKCALYKLLARNQSNKLNSEVSQFNQSAIHRVSQLRLDEFQRALELAVADHEALRTTFRYYENKFVQVVNQFSLSDYFELEDYTQAEMDAPDLDREIQKRIDRHFDFVHDPLFKISALKIFDGWILVFVINHIISDGHSLGNIIRQLTTKYSLLIDGHQVGPERNIQLKDYASWENNFLLNHPEHENHWLVELADAPRFPLKKFFRKDITSQGSSYRQTLKHELAREFSNIEQSDLTALFGRYHRGTSYPGKLMRSVITAGAYLEVQSFSKRTLTTNFALLLTSLQILLSKLADTTDVIVGYESNNRHSPSLQNVTGWLAGTVLIRKRLMYDKTIDQLVAENFQAELNTTAGMSYPIDRLLDKLDISLDALGSLYLNYQVSANESSVPVSQGELDIDSPCYFHIDFSVMEYFNGLEISCRYRTDLFDQHLMKRILKIHNYILTTMVTPNMTLGELLNRIPVRTVY